MKSLRSRSVRPLAARAAAVWVLAAGIASAQSTTPPSQADPEDHDRHAQHAPPPAASDTGQAIDLAREIAVLRAQVAELQAALARGHAQGAAPQQNAMRRGMQPGPMMGSGAAGAGPLSGQGGGMGMPGMGRTAGMQGTNSTMTDMMAGMGRGMAGMGGMGQGSAGMGMMNTDMTEMMGMMGMGSMPMGGMGSLAAESTPSTLPGFPGASRLYHIGSTGLFLDHPEHITLTLEQRAALNRKKEEALLEQGDFTRQIEQAEQELWVMTGADQPDVAAIDQKAREIAKLQVDRRLAFIHAVGDAATVLTAEQRRQLTGMLPPRSAPAGSAVPMGGAMAEHDL